MLLLVVRVGDVGVGVVVSVMSELIQHGVSVMLSVSSLLLLPHSMLLLVVLVLLF